jgi:hypothetical protein
MLPLASGTGIGILGGTIGVSLLFLWWLLRAESRDADEEEAVATTEGDDSLAAREAEVERQRS